MPRVMRLEMLDEAMIDVLRLKTPADRLALSNGMWRSARQMIEAMLIKEHPDWSVKAIQNAVATRLAHGAE